MLKAAKSGSCKSYKKGASFPSVPWSPKQHRLFEAAAHSPAVAKRVGIPVATASRMASEGVKQKLSKALTGKR